MKSSLRITLAAIGLISSILISAAASPAASKLASVDYIVDNSSVSSEFIAEIEIEKTDDIQNGYEILKIEDEKIKPTKFEKKPQPVSSAPQKKPASSSAPSSSSPSSSSSSQSSSSPPSSSSAPQSTPNNVQSGEVLKFRSNGVNYSLPVKEALKKIVSNEVNDALSYEAVKAQVVATHTFIKYYNNSGSYASVGAKSSYKVGGKVDRAVEEVYNEIMTFNGNAIFSPYFSCSAGRTQSSKEVWGGARSYLVSVESKYDHLSSAYLGRKNLSSDYVKERIINKLGVTPSGDPSTWFQFLDANNGGATSGGYVNNIVVAGKTTTGKKIREILNLRSAAFEISYANGNFTFTTKGYGHGAGMSQWGAHFYAQNEGWNYRQILSHYYTGITFSNAA